MSQDKFDEMVRARNIVLGHGQQVKGNWLDTHISDIRLNDTYQRKYLNEGIGAAKEFRTQNMMTLKDGKFSPKVPTMFTFNGENTVFMAYHRGVKVATKSLKIPALDADLNSSLVQKYTRMANSHVPLYDAIKRAVTAQAKDKEWRADNPATMTMAALLQLEGFFEIVDDGEVREAEVLDFEAEGDSFDTLQNNNC